MTFCPNLSVCFLIVKDKQYTKTSSILFRLWRLIIAQTWLADVLYLRTKKFESTKLQELEKTSLKSAVRFQFGLLSSSKDGLQQDTGLANQLEGQVLSLLLPFRTLIDL